MIAKEKRKQIVKLTLEGHSEAEICRQTGVSRNAVRRAMDSARRLNPKKLIMKHLAKVITMSLRNKQAEKGVCPICNRKVSMPCPYCLIKHYNQLCKHPVEYEEYTESDVFRESDPSEKALKTGSVRYNTLELRPAEQKRYEAIRRAKEAQMAKK